jgi:hypothetical protein
VIATNLPLRWSDWSGGTSYALSGYVGIAAKQAIRINIASFKPSRAPFEDILMAFEPDSPPRGRITDVGVGYQYYPRRLFDGLTLEAGLFVRHIDVYVRQEWNDVEVDTDGNGVAARALVGWSWLMWQRLFISTAIGASAGRYAGTEHRARFDEPMTTTDFVRYHVDIEAFVRVGIAFGL